MKENAVTKSILKKQVHKCWEWSVSLVTYSEKLRVLYTVIKCLPGGRWHRWSENTESLDTAVKDGKKHQIRQIKKMPSRFEQMISRILPF